MKARPKRPSPPPPEIDDDDELVELPAGGAVQSQPDEIEQLIASLGGDRQVTATVYRDIGEGFKAMDGMHLRPDMGLEDVLKFLATRYGHGRYKLQLREANQRGTIGNVNLPEIEKGAFGGPVGALSPSPPAVPAPNPMMDLLVKQNEQLFGLMRESLLKPATPATSMQEQLGMFATLFKFSRGLSRAAGEAELPGWMETIGKVVAPIIATVAENMQKPKPAPAPQRKPVENVAAVAGTAGATPTPSAPIPAPAAAQDDQDGEEEPTSTELVIQGILSAAATDPAPDADRYAALIWNIAGQEFTAIAGIVPPGTIAAQVLVQVPALKGKEEFCQKLETALRAKAAPPQAPQNGVNNAAQ